MTISGFIAYAIQTWKNKPDTSTPLSAARLAHIEAGIKANSDAITKLAAAVINQQANDVNKIPSSALMYSVNEKVDSAISDLASVNSKMPTDLTYITSVMPRIKDIIGIEGQNYQLLSDVAYAISVKGIKSGGFGFNNQLYSDRPVNTSNWGYVEYFQHADNYVTVKLYPESSLDIFIRRFTINTMTWNTDWRKLSTTDVVN